MGKARAGGGKKSSSSGRGGRGGFPLGLVTVLAALCAAAWGAVLYLDAPSAGATAEKPAAKTSSASPFTKKPAPERYAPDPALEKNPEPSSAPPPRIAQRHYPGPVKGQPARMAIILDDAGYDKEAAERAMKTGLALTFSVLPFSPHGEELAKEFHRRGFEVWLHLPMEPENPSVDPGPGAIRAGMTRDQAMGAVLDALKALPYVAGVNNHMGSRATRDAQLMKWVLGPIRDQRLLFVDSKTTPETAAFAAAKTLGVACSIRDVFLDTEPSLENALHELRRLEAAAMDQGTAIGIGHFYPTTLAALEKYAASMDRKKVKIVPASEIVEAENTPLEL